MWWPREDAATSLDAEQIQQLLARMDDLDEGMKSVKERVQQWQHSKMDDSFEVAGDDDDDNIWREIGSGELISTPETDAFMFDLSQDVYSFLATSSYHSTPFWLAVVVVFGFQFTLLLLLLLDQTDFDNSLSDNPLRLPENVEISVRVSQILLMMIAMFQQEDLLVGIETLVRGKERFKNMSSFAWNLSCLLRVWQGLLGLFAAFILSIQSETVFDVVLNVLGVEFVSNLDDVAFELGNKGYFGRYVKRATIEVEEATFYREKKRDWFKRSLHIIMALIVLAAVWIALIVVFVQQDKNTLAIREVEVHFTDEVLPFLGMFSGCYIATEEDKGFGDRRLFYEQAGFPEGGKFGFCEFFDNGESGWTFFVDHEIRNPCESYVLRSEDTVTFSILEAGEELEWFADDESIGSLEISELVDSIESCGAAMYEASLKACPVIQALGSQTLTRLVGTNSSDLGVDEGIIDRMQQRQALDLTMSHAIYFGKPESVEDTGYDLVFFVGRRWMWATTDKIPALKNTTSVSNITDYFYNSERTTGGIFGMLLDTQVEEGWIRFVSELVDPDSESPLGLEWFSPLYSNESMDDARPQWQAAFPVADTSRPLDSESGLTCQFCNDETNPCLYEGECVANVGKCKCQHGADGALCEETPTGNGICNIFFNTAEHNYDGGDCCAATCEGSQCGRDDLPDPYSNTAPAYNWLDPFDTEGMLQIAGKDDDWIQAVQGRSIAFGVDITADLNFQFIPRRFEHCFDPDLAAIRIDVIPSPSAVENSPDLLFDGVTVECDSTIYLRSPTFGVTEFNRSKYSEEIHVPYGSSCRISFGGLDYFNGASLFATSNMEPLIQLDESCPVNLYIPQSECVWDAFGTESISVLSDAFDDQNCKLSNSWNASRQIKKAEFDTLGSDPILAKFCQDDAAQLLERYHVWDILSKGTGKSWSASVGHICNGGWNSGPLSLSCSELRVRRLALKSDAPASFIDGMTSNLKYFANLDRVEVQNRNATVDGLLQAMEGLNVSSLVLRSDILPSEVGLLQGLRELQLTSTSLASLPAELFLLSDLEQLLAHGTTLISLPSGIGNLSSLMTLDLGGNKLVSLPTEIGLVQPLQLLNLESNGIGSLPTQIGGLTSLEHLLLKSNLLSTLPSSIGMMTSLKSLDLANNTLLALPSEIGLLSNLTSLDVSKNPQLSTLPNELGSLTSLEIFGLQK